MRHSKTLARGSSIGFGFVTIWKEFIFELNACSYEGTGLFREPLREFRYIFSFLVVVATVLYEI